MKDLTLHVKRVYFDQIKAGTKPFEYRLVNGYWTKRLAGSTTNGEHDHD